MTSINALRLNHDEGLMICDEVRYWNPEWVVFFTPEKIRQVTNRELGEEQQTWMFMGQTGSSSVGDEFIVQVEKEYTRLYSAEKKKLCAVPEKFKTLAELAQIAQDVCTRIKREHIDDYLVGQFGFRANDLVEGKYSSKDREITIKDDKVIEEAVNLITNKGAPQEVKGIYGNSQVLAGYRPECGFKIFYMTERWPVCEEVHEIFLAQGSGRDTCELQFSRFADTRSIMERRDSVDRVDGLIALLKGLNFAFRQTAGVCGYPKIIYFNGKEKNVSNRVREICDRRSKLAAEIASANMDNLITDEKTYELIDQLIFKGKNFTDVNRDFFKYAEPKTLSRFLRGYQRGLIS